MKRIVDSQEYWPRIAEFVSDQIGYGRKTDNFTAIGLMEDEKIIAGVVYSDYNGSNITAAIAGVGKNWLTREFLWFMFYYPFCQAGAKRLTACVEQTNIVSQQFVEHLGFELEFAMKDAGKTGDMLMYRMFKKDCRYLERRNDRKKINRDTDAPRLQRHGEVRSTAAA